MRRVAGFLLGCLLAAACGEINPAAPPTGAASPQPTVRLLLVGDVMLGRGVAPMITADPSEVFAGVRHLISGADVAAANLESPLTGEPHISDNQNDLAADPSAAEVLAAAGFDLVSVANNHSTDAGRPGLLETLRSVRRVGLQSVGAGTRREDAFTAAGFEIKGVRIGFVAFDATGVAMPATAGEPGVAVWDPATTPEFVQGLGDDYDILVASIHGGTEYLPVTDPGMAEVAAELTASGVDIVWGHGAHVVQPTQLDGAAVVATSLGNLLFDQSGPDRTTGALLEVLVDAAGVVAYRVGITEHPDRRVEFVEWLAPDRNAVWLHDSWWELARQPVSFEAGTVALTAFRHGDLVAAAQGDITGDGSDEVVASFRRPHQTTQLMQLRPDVQWADASGRSAHLGVYDPDGLREIWVAGTVVMPVAGLAVCDGSIATVHDQLDDSALIAAGAWTWNGFGFDTAPDLPGPGTPGCADVDGDGSTEPVIFGR